MNAAKNEFDGEGLYSISELLSSDFLGYEELRFIEILRYLNGKQVNDISEKNCIPKLVDRIRFCMEYYFEQLIRDWPQTVLIRESRCYEKAAMLLWQYAISTQNDELLLELVWNFVTILLIYPGRFTKSGRKRLLKLMHTSFYSSKKHVSDFLVWACHYADPLPCFQVIKSFLEDYNNTFHTHHKFDLILEDSEYERANIEIWKLLCNCIDR